VATIFMVYLLSLSFLFIYYCHNQTNNTKQNKKFGWSGIIIGKKPQHSTPFLVCILFLTQLEEIWKTTSIFFLVEDDLNFFGK
jgi:hypothetical protein